MIDFINAIITGINPKELELNQHLNFCNEVNTSTGEIRTKKRNTKNKIPHINAFYRGLEFKIYDNDKIYLNGSLHKYWNSGAHNYNDFNLLAIHETLKDIKQKFNIKPEQVILRQLELGVNIVPPQPTKKILQHIFIHRTEPFKWIHTADEGNYIQAKHSQYVVKIYDKRQHYVNKGFVIDNEILRFEIKYLKLEKLKKLSIYTLHDLIDYGLNNLVFYLVEEWQQILFYDYTITSNSSAIKNYCNPLYWNNLIEQKRYSAYYKHQNKLKELVKNTSAQIQLTISELIKQKGIELTKGTNIDRLYILSKLAPLHDQKTNICIVTGLNIEMQKEDSFLLSHTGLKYYYQTDKKVFNEVKRKYLSDKWINADYKTQIKEIAHNIRNRNNNLKLKQKRIYPKDQFRLFEL